MNTCFLSLSCLWNLEPSPVYDQPPTHNRDSKSQTGFPEQPCCMRVAAFSASSLLEEGCAPRDLHGREGGPLGTLRENHPELYSLCFFPYCSSCVSSRCQRHESLAVTKTATLYVESCESFQHTTEHVGGLGASPNATQHPQL